MNTSRRQFLSLSTSLGTSLVLKACTPRSASTPPRPAPSPAAPGASVTAEGLAAKADYELRIGTGLVELADDHIASTTLYNGQFPGPLLRLVEGQRVTVEVHNDTDTPELVHWHGQMIPSDVDGGSEEGSPFVPARGMRRISFVPKPAGFRFYHTHVPAGSDLPRLRLRTKRSR